MLLFSRKPSVVVFVHIKEGAGDMIDITLVYHEEEQLLLYFTSAGFHVLVSTQVY